MKTMVGILIALTAMASAGCASRIPWDDGMAQEINLGMTMRQVETAFGQPTQSFTDDEGYEVWTYRRSNSSPAASSLSTPQHSLTVLTIRFWGERVTSHTFSTETTTVTTH